jgi:hypothetical protein
MQPDNQLLIDQAIAHLRRLRETYDL